jgi:DNA-binding transcriptional MerR regulator/DNA gyrase inhibitor GyrI
MYSIGQFSKITGLSVKTIRLYQEKGLVAPIHVDQSTGYRYYDRACVERARVVQYLKEMAFSLSDIKQILDGFEDDAEIVRFLETQRHEIERRLETLGRIASSLDGFIKAEKEAAVMLAKGGFEVTEKSVADQQVATIRWKGSYAETGKAVGRVARYVARRATGAPFNLYWDAEYKDTDADIETGFPVSGLTSASEVTLKTLPGGRCVSLVHRGPYDEIGRSYQRVFDYLSRKGYEPQLPSREIYLKGPGMIFRGNPKNYLTEIQVFICEKEEA